MAGTVKIEFTIDDENHEYVLSRLKTITEELEKIITLVNTSRLLKWIFGMKKPWRLDA